VTSIDAYREVLAAYPDDCQPTSLVRLDHGGFSGARLWRLETARGPACLRRWPSEHPPPDRLEFIQAVLWHVDREGFHLVPVPFETREHAGYVRHQGHLWELTPWLPGTADYRQAPSAGRLGAALAALARFHRAAESFPLPSDDPAPSPGLAQRAATLSGWRSGGAERIVTGLDRSDWPELAHRGRQIVALFHRALARGEAELLAALPLGARLQPCIRDIWHEHVLYIGETVTGLVDFGALRPESVAADVARLLGSMVDDDPAGWTQGLAAYELIRPLTADERLLVRAFDRSTVLLGGMQWLEWIVLEGRVFARRAAVLQRLDENLARLTRLARVA
jgi:homoserine kinase type II